MKLTRFAFTLAFTLVAAVAAPAFAPGAEPDHASLVASDPILGADAPTLQLWSEVTGVPAVLTEAVAYVESGHDLRPALRGRAGEWGRFQILPNTAARRCPNHDVATYQGNLACFFRIMRENYLRCRDWRCAIERYNGRGGAARAYADRVLAVVQHRVLWEVNR